MISGEIRVNDFLLFAWEAQNLGPVGLDDLCIYEVEVSGLTNENTPFNIDFQVLHTRSLGITVLTQKIMEEINARLSNGYTRITGQNFN